MGTKKITLGKLIIQMRKYKIEFILCISINFTCVKEVKRKEKSLKLLEENILQYP